MLDRLKRLIVALARAAWARPAHASPMAGRPLGHDELGAVAGAGSNVKKYSSTDA